MFLYRTHANQTFVIDSTAREPSSNYLSCRLGHRYSKQCTLGGPLQRPVLFLLVMDPLLRGLEANHLGPSLHDAYVGAFAHADDIRTITSNLSTLKQQMEFVQKLIFVPTMLSHSTCLSVKSWLCHLPSLS